MALRLGTFGVAIAFAFITTQALSGALQSDKEEDEDVDLNQPCKTCCDCAIYTL